MKIAVLSQVVNGVVLPFVLIFMLLLINKKELMGEYVNTRLFNVVAWLTTVIMIGADGGVVLDAAVGLEQFSRGQISHQRHVGFQKIVLGQILGVGPLQCP